MNASKVEGYRKGAINGGQEFSPGFHPGFTHSVTKMGTSSRQFAHLMNQVVSATRMIAHESVGPRPWRGPQKALAWEERDLFLVE